MSHLSADTWVLRTAQRIVTKTASSPIWVLVHNPKSHMLSLSFTKRKEQDVADDSLGDLVCSLWMSFVLA